MTAKRTIIAMALLAIASLAAACIPARATETKPTETSAPAATAVPAATGEPPTVTPTSQPRPTFTPEANSEATSLEEDCMAICHIPDPNDYYGAGAKPLPANHVERTTCLTCHTTADAPALPATHLGRLDPACRGCHK